MFLFPVSERYNLGNNQNANAFRSRNKDIVNAKFRIRLNIKTDTKIKHDRLIILLFDKIRNVVILIEVAITKATT